jgi:hypothetical protein
MHVLGKEICDKIYRLIYMNLYVLLLQYHILYF